MRVLTPTALAALAAPAVPLALLVEMDFASGPLRLCTSRVDLTLNGTTYYGTKGLGRVEAVKDTPAEVQQLKFELTGVPSTSVALALTEGDTLQGTPARIKFAIFDPTTYQLLDVRVRWAGRLNTMTITDDASAGKASLAVTAEHAGIDLLRGVASLYTDAEQQRLYPGDLSMQYVSAQAEQRIVWPAAAWARK